MSGCYQCGSSEGNDARLCPQCNSARQSKVADFESVIRSTRAMRVQSGTSISPGLFGAAGIIFLIFAAGVWRYQSHIKIYFGRASAEDLYEVCVGKFAGQLNSSGNEMGKVLGTVIYTGMCDEIRSICRKRPDGKECSQIKEVFKNLAR